MPTAFAVMSFFFIEALFWKFQNNLEAGFLPALLSALVAFSLAQFLACKWANRANNPHGFTCDLPMPLVFAEVKRTLKEYNNHATRWNITFDDPVTGNLHATFLFFDNTWNDMRDIIPEGRLERLITLDVTLHPHEGSTTVCLYWHVKSPISAGDCYAVIAEVSDQIYTTLTDRVVEKNGK
jgi:hypothetical protein